MNSKQVTTFSMIIGAGLIAYILYIQLELKKTKALLIVHVLGNCVDMTKLMQIIKKHKLILIEDTCESLGTKFKNKYLGTFGDF